MSDSTTSTVLSEVVTGLTAAAPVAGNIGEAAKLADDLVELFGPDVKSATNDKPINEYKERIQKYESIIENPNEAVRDTQLGNFVNGLFVDAGIPIGVVGNVYR